MGEQTWIDPRCDRSKWPAGEWDGEPDKVQWKDPATGIDCLAKRNYLLGHWCGYVGVAPTHPWHGKYSDSMDVDVHGGLTYARECEEGDPELTVCHIPAPGEPEHLWWLGFDCAHCNDYSPENAARGRSKGCPWTIGPDEKYRTLDYVRRQCAKLAAQIAAAESA